MAMGASTWFLSPQSLVARVDVVDGNATWTGPGDLAEVFPALLCFGVNRDRLVQFADHFVGRVSAVQQTAVNEAVFRVDVRSWREGMQTDYRRNVRLDLATGKVIEYPAIFDTSRKTEGWREYQIRDHSTWSVFNAVTRQLIVEHNWSDAVFALPNGQRVGLPADGSTMGVDRGKLFVKTTESASAYRVFDLDNLTTDGKVKGQYGGIENPTGFEPMFTLVTDPDAWGERGPAGDIDRKMLMAVNVAAHNAGANADLLLRILHAESGIRTGAYHPSGRYGLLQLTAEQLAAAGWADSPDAYLDAGAAQLPVIAAHLRRIGVPEETDEAGLWLCHLLGRVYTAEDLATPVATANGVRPDIWATHAVADMDGDGVLTVEDLHRYLRSLRRDPRLVDVQYRIGRMSAVVPDWQDLTEINEGDDMGVVRPSAESLGLLVGVVALQNHPGFHHERVVSIDPAPGTLQRLVDPVTVQVNFEG
ncbi:hypothetical protein E4P42_01365 [Mycobacterium sp. PS03-16]|uniref:hypothetical protein n=1 Tax=Mycobacterium sp. PS03-16 TaxID=2559611 RepID=UPI0010735B8E|nr:hypothetical protein [Mycobacterium sp. PS03-16]TFV61570.1 hypothetical protein E4P42_01365 [Mycobacterium sp. PS03-16]